jgi:F420-non-reducing hydrogenase large subunit
MSRVTLDSLRWQEQPAQATVTVNGGPPHVYFQITAPRDVAAICHGRPVEELPRILSILSPAHHLCAAQALDRLFGVEPPPVAKNMREALRLALFFRHHLQKFYFLLTSQENPFADFYSEQARRGPRTLRPLLDDLMRHASLAQEAAAALGGRADHPVTALAGGVSRALRPEHHERLAEIATALRSCAERLAGFLRQHVFPQGEILGEVRGLVGGPLGSLTVGPDADGLVLRDARGGEVERFAATAIFDKVGLQRETWSYEPFAFLKAKGWQGLGATPSDGLFFVGPLARLNDGAPAATPLAEAERQRLVEALGALPRFEVVAAYWALLVELLAAAEGLVALCDVEKLSGPALRAIPKAPGREGHAALESPQGLIVHHFRADERGLVEEVRVFDTATANNALFALLAQRAVESSLAGSAGARPPPWEEMKRRIELSLLAY